MSPNNINSWIAVTKKVKFDQFWLWNFFRKTQYFLYRISIEFYFYDPNTAWLQFLINDTGIHVLAYICMHMYMEIIFRPLYQITRVFAPMHMLEPRSRSLFVLTQFQLVSNFIQTWYIATIIEFTAHPLSHPVFSHL